MSEFKRQYFEAGTSLSSIPQADRAVGGAEITIYFPSLRYSSPRPWLLALTIGITMWGFLVWLIWFSMM
jgi:hypothetical protein